jgi:hypothetical protein
MRKEHEESIRTRTLHEEAHQFEVEAEHLQELSERLTAGLQALDAYRRSLADDLPIPGLEVDGEIIKVDGIPFDQLNTAQRIDIAVKIACLRAKDKSLPVLWVDGAEALDSENFGHLVEAVKSQGVQAFIGRVTDQDFKVEAK